LEVNTAVVEKNDLGPPPVEPAAAGPWLTAAELQRKEQFLREKETYDEASSIAREKVFCYILFLDGSVGWLISLILLFVGVHFVSIYPHFMTFT